MLKSKCKFLAIIGATIALVFFGLVLQFNAAANAVAVFQTQGIDSTDASLKVKKSLSETGGVSSVRLDPARGIILAVFDSRAVDPRIVAESLTRQGFPTRIGELMTMREYNAITSGSAGCESGNSGCGNCSKNK
jgi:copper chaperone CopZ